MIRAIIIDDEIQNANSLRNDLDGHCPQVQTVVVCTSAKEGILAIKKEKPDLLFLDIEMPWMNGFEMLELIGDINFNIIFTTAYDQFAAKAFRISAVDYLLKPIDSNDLKAAVRKVEERMQHQQGQANIENLLENMRQPSAKQRIALPNRDGHEFVEVSQIVYCHAEGAYTKVFLADKRNILVSKTLGDIEEVLPANLFQRIHHSAVVNVEYITHFIRTGGGHVKLKTGEELAVSKSKRDGVLARLGLKKD